MSNRSIDKYEIIRKIGRGRYSDLYEGVKAEDGTHVAIKILRPIKKEKIKREVKVLQTLSKGHNVVKYVDIVKDPATKTTSIVMSYHTSSIR